MVCDYAPARYNKQFQAVDKYTTVVKCLPIHKKQGEIHQPVCMKCWNAKMLYYVKNYNVAHRGRDLVIKAKNNNNFAVVWFVPGLGAGLPPVF